MTCDYSWYLHFRRDRERSGWYGRKRYLHFKQFTAQLNYIEGQMMCAQKVKLQFALVEFNLGLFKIL